MRAVAALEMRVPRLPCGTIPSMSEPASIVIIEDDADINEVVAVHLRRNGFACTQAFSAARGGCCFPAPSRSTS